MADAFAVCAEPRVHLTRRTDGQQNALLRKRALQFAEAKGTPSSFDRSRSHLCNCLKGEENAGVANEFEISLFEIKRIVVRDPSEDHRATTTTLADTSLTTG